MSPRDEHPCSPSRPLVLIGPLPVGERAWIKAKNREGVWELEREGALKRRRVRQFV